MKNRFRWSLGLVAVLAVASCSDASDPTAPSTSQPASAASTLPSTGTASSGEVVVVPTPSVVDPSTTRPTTSGGLSMAPLPAGLTTDEEADAQAAIDVYRKYWELTDRSGAEPGSDWTEQVAQVAIGTAADMFTKDLSYLSTSGYRTVGRTAVQASVSKVEPALVHVRGCIDVSGTDVLDASGNSVGVDNGPGTFTRFPTTAQIAKFEGGHWFVAVDTFDRTTTC